MSRHLTSEESGTHVEMSTRDTTCDPNSKGNTDTPAER